MIKIENKMEKGTWTFTRDGVPEKVELERWIWGVTYDDGTELHQFDDNGVFHQFGEVDQSKVKLYTLYKPLDDDNKRIDIISPKDAKMFYKYRNIKPYYSKVFLRAYYFGWHKGEQFYNLFILPDDRIIVSDREDIDLVAFNIQPPKQNNA